MSTVPICYCTISLTKHIDGIVKNGSNVLKSLWSLLSHRSSYLILKGLIGPTIA